MKSILIATVFTLLTSNTFAMKCLQKQDSSVSQLPEQLCYENIGIYDSGDMKWLEVYGGNMAGTYSLDEKYDQNGGYSAVAVLKLDSGAENGEYCQSKRTSEIQLTFSNESSSKNSETKMKVVINSEFYQDSCHSFGEFQTVEYK